MPRVCTTLIMHPAPAIGRARLLLDAAEAGTLRLDEDADLAIFFTAGPWDLAGPALVVEEAGGRFSDLLGQYDFTSGTAVFSNGYLHDGVVQFTSPNAFRKFASMRRLSLAARHLASRAVDRRAGKPSLRLASLSVPRRSYPFVTSAH